MSCSFIGNVIDNHTLLYHIVKKAKNGDQIVQKILDDYVTTNSSMTEKIESYNYKLDKFEDFETIRVDFSRLKSTPLLGNDNESIKPSPKSCSIISDITLLSNEKKGEILLHPVIQSYIDFRWNKTRILIWLSFSIYFIFLLTYCFFLRNIFFRPLHEEAIFGDIFTQNIIDDGSSTKLPQVTSRFGEISTCQKIQEFCAQISCKPLPEDNEFNSTTNATFSRCGDNSKGNLTCSLEVLLSITLSLLAIMHVFKLISLGPIRRWKDIRRVFNFENGVEFVVRVFGITSLVIQHNEQRLQYCSAIGIMFTFVGRLEF